MSAREHAAAATCLSALLLLGLTATACVDEKAGEASEIVVDTLPSGRIHVGNTASGQWDAESRWRLTEDLRLGCVEGCGPELFSQVAYILTDEDERIYVLDYPSQEIRVFSADGAHIQTLGGEGDGPGELRGAAGLDWGPDGRLWVWGSRRYQVLERSGEEIARYTRPIRGVVYPWMGGFTPDGRYIDYGVDLETAGVEDYGQYAIPVLTGRGSLPVVAFTPPDRFDSLPSIQYQADITDEGQRKREGRSFVGIQDTAGHLWFALTDEYTVHRRSLDGDTLRTFSRPGEPIPIPTAEMDSVIAAWEQRNAPGPPLERSSFATHRWLVTNILLDEGGHVLVFPQEIGVPQGTAVDVFLTSGIYQGRMTFPDTVLTEGPPPHITERHVYAVVENELDIPFVVRYRIDKPLDGPASH